MSRSPQSIGFALAAAAAATVALSPIAHAQTESQVALPFTLKLGAFVPSDKGTRDFSGKGHLLLDATWEFGRLADSSVLYGAYFDSIFQMSDTFKGYNQITGFNSIVTGRMSGYGAGLQARYVIPSGRRDAGLRPYVGGGVGVYGVTAKQHSDGDITAAGAMQEVDDSHTTTGLGGKLVLGVQSRSGFLGEVSYHFLPDVYGYDFSGYGFSLGYRF